MSTIRTAPVGPLVAAVSNGYAQSQAGTAGTPLTLNGSLVTGGVGIPDVPRRLIITSAGSDTGITFTVTGQMVKNGPIVTEVMQGTAGAATNLQGQAFSMLDYATVLSITPSGNTASTVTAGTNGVASTSWIRLDTWGYAPISLEVIVVGTVNYTVEAALRDPNDLVLGGMVTNLPQLTPAQLIWQEHPNLQAQTANGFDTYATVPTWVRCTLNSETGTGNCVFTANQPVSGLRL